MTFVRADRVARAEGDIMIPGPKLYQLHGRGRTPGWRVRRPCLIELVEAEVEGSSASTSFAAAITRFS